LSKIVTRQPSARRESTRWLPMNPAPPVTRACFMSWENFTFASFFVIFDVFVPSWL